MVFHKKKIKAFKRRIQPLRKVVRVARKEIKRPFKTKFGPLVRSRKFKARTLRSAIITPEAFGLNVKRRRR